ncbi:MAG TPA: bifunctional pyr operon transcriptional regulator/uracil phosphoribosyltransferase PyrR [Solirubrobacteraceae bacterium]|nr:bifunctional pyr operon transcriptional regulator/uracil phosphoribosyltransferase PyrR [Solirubrobacteraceae bacterium]
MDQSSEKVVLREGDVQRALTRIAHEIAERNPRAGGDHRDAASLHNGASAPGSDPPADLAIVGIHRRGAFLAGRLRELLEDLLGAEVPLGDLDIGFYRDDVASRPDAPVVHASHIDFDIGGRTVVIVDDVLFTGRTVRAAIEALFDYGRPERVQLAVLADRGHRELPIRPDYVGKNLPTSRAEHVHVRVRELDGVDEVAIAPAAVEVA